MNIKTTLFAAVAAVGLLLAAPVVQTASVTDHAVVYADTVADHAVVQTASVTDHAVEGVNGHIAFKNSTTISAESATKGGAFFGTVGTAGALHI